MFRTTFVQNKYINKLFKRSGWGRGRGWGWGWGWGWGEGEGEGEGVAEKAKTFQVAGFGEQKLSRWKICVIYGLMLSKNTVN